MECVEFFDRIVHENRLAKGDYGAVVHGVIEDGTREDEAVGERDGDADGKAIRKIAQRAACGGAVEIKKIVDARIHCGNDVRLFVSSETDVADEAFIENFIDSSGIVNGALRFAHDARALRGCDGIRHLDTVGETKR